MSAALAYNQTTSIQPSGSASALNLPQARTRQEIQRIVQEREIPFLVHFTQVENLTSIMQHGLLSRVHASNSGKVTEMYVSDGIRLDGRLDAISLSIAFPNDSMFFCKRRDFSPEKWVVLLLDASILWEKDSAFYRANAASNQMRYCNDYFLKRAEALEGMFYPPESRDLQGLMPYDPTDVQAEVMVFEPIESRLLLAAAFYSEQMLSAHADLFADTDIELGVQGLGLFGWRTDAR